MKESGNKRTRDRGSKGSIPAALRICLRCGELAAGAACDTCAEIERLSSRMARECIALGVPCIAWAASANLPLAVQLLRAQTNDKFLALQEEARRAAALLAQYACPGCHVEVGQPGYCPECLATAAESWQHADLAAARQYSEQLLGVLTEEKFRGLQAELRHAVTLPVYHECPGCHFEIAQPGYCPDCLAAPPGSWKRTELAAGRHYAEKPRVTARDLRTAIYISMFAAAWLWVMWPFRERIFDAVASWFGSL